MKEKIIIFITGLLIGAVISTASIYVYTLANNSNNNPTLNKEFNMPNDRQENMTPPNRPDNNQNKSNSNKGV